MVDAFHIDLTAIYFIGWCFFYPEARTLFPSTLGLVEHFIKEHTLTTTIPANIARKGNPSHPVFFGYFLHKQSFKVGKLNFCFDMNSIAMNKNNMMIPLKCIIL